MDVSDATLVQGAQHGDRAAFRELYDRKARLILAICHDHTRDIDVAADLAQEVFLRCYTHLNRLREPDQFVSWLIGIARRICSEWKRREVRERQRVTGLAESMRDASPVVPDQVDRGEALRDAIAALPDTERLALHAFYLQELDVEQARAVLGLSRSGFYYVLSSARAHLRDALERGGQSPARLNIETKEVLQ